MTVIAYTPGWLGADSRAVANPEELGELAILASQVRRKLSVLAGGRFAAANTGAILTQAEWEELERLLLHYLMILEEFEPDNAFIKFEDEHANASVLRERQMFVLTRRHFYLVSREEGRSLSKPVGLTRMDPSESFALGSGMNIAVTAFAAGLDCRQALELVVQQDMLTGPPLVFVEQASLKPLLKQPRVKGKAQP